MNNSIIISKMLVAITGLLMVVFILGHTAANILVFLGPDLGRDLLNAYAVGLRQTPLLLWGARIGLTLSVIIHIVLSIKLTMLNKAANPVQYKVNHTKKADFFSKGMPLFGLVILFFVIYHLMHYTLGVTNPELMELKDAQGRHDVYAMVVAGFSQPLISIFYVLAVVALGAHLKHGIQSMVHTLGLNGKVLSDRVNKIGALIATLITLLLALIPISVLLGLVK